MESTHEISFSPGDEGEPREPHGDALMITTDVAEIDVARFLVGIGSSADILFMDCLRGMNLNVKLEPVETALLRIHSHWTR